MARRKRRSSIPKAPLVRTEAHNTTDLLTQGVISYLVSKTMAVYREFGVIRGGARRVDVMALSLSTRLTAVEVKRDFKDFLTDKKMVEYLDYCDYFYVCVATKEEASKVAAYIKTSVYAARRGIGVMYLNPISGLISVLKSAKMMISITESDRWRLILKCAWMCEGDNLTTHTRRQRIFLPPQPFEELCP